MDDLLLRKRVSVQAEGELVLMRFGNVEVKMPYDEALKFSQWVRVQAKAAKAAAGDGDKHWSIMGVLDAER